MPTIGLIVVGLGAVLVLLSLFALDFLSVSLDLGELGVADSTSTDLSDIRSGEGLPVALDMYANFGYLLAILAIAWAVVAALRLPAVHKGFPQAPIVAAVVAGVFLVWHVLAMFASVEGVDTSPDIGAYIGVVGYVGLMAGQFLPRPISSSQRTARTR